MIEEPEPYEQILFRLKGKTETKFTQLSRPPKLQDREIEHEYKELGLSKEEIKERQKTREQANIKSYGQKLF